jgi:hypothetical protein
MNFPKNAYACPQFTEKEELGRLTSGISQFFFNPGP